MARSKYVTGGVIASIIWLIIGTVAIVFRNSEEARVANAAARAACRGREDFSACVDAFYAAAGGSPEIDWGTIGLRLAAGLVVIWVVVLVMKAVRGNKAGE